MAAETAYFVLNFAPRLELVRSVRRFVASFYSRTLANPDDSARVALSTHELLENAVKYNTGEETNIAVRVSEIRGGHRILVRTRNSATDTNIGEVEVLLERLRAAEEPECVYLEMMRATAKRAGGSGLGLARVVAEGEMAVSCRATDSQVEITAQLFCPSAGPA